MAASQILHANGIQLRPFAKDLISDRYIGWLNDRDLMKYSRQRFTTHTAETCASFFASFDNSPDYFWAIIAEGDSLGHIGNLTASVDVHNNTADLTIMVGERQAGGRGFGLKAWISSMTFLLSERGIRKVTAGTMAINAPMLKIMRNSNMVLDCVRPRHFLVDDQEIDCIIYAKYANAL